MRLAVSFLFAKDIAELNIKVANKKGWGIMVNISEQDRLENLNMVANARTDAMEIYLQARKQAATMLKEKYPKLSTEQLNSVMNIFPLRLL